MKIYFSLLVVTFFLVVSTADSFARDKLGGRSSGYGYTNSKSHNVRGYTKRDGTYVAPHRSTNPNSTGRDNYSTKGNTNPWTGESGSQYVDK